MGRTLNFFLSSTDFIFVLRLPKTCRYKYLVSIHSCDNLSDIIRVIFFWGFRGLLLRELQILSHAESYPSIKLTLMCRVQLEIQSSVLLDKMYTQQDLNSVSGRVYERHRKH